ncbi:PEGA domain-containing protein, partial [Aliarcobacter butzleri]|uniref:PEGA domain-containing protein n=1 Tax=Aliarcobacter butzleri TaxID=28197 RepID=UPI002B24600B
MSDKKGFSGLDSLSTDIDDIIRENDKKIEENTEENKDNISNSNNDITDNIEKSNTSNTTNDNTNNGSSSWIWWIIAIGIFVWILIQSNSHSPSTTYSSNTNYESTKSASSNTRYESAKSTQECYNKSMYPSKYYSDGSVLCSSSSLESLPSASQQNYNTNTSSDDYYESKPDAYLSILNKNQVLYCEAEKIRLAAVQNKIDLYSTYEVDIYNSLTNDYNSRCANKQYYKNDMYYVDRNIEKKRYQLQQDGLARFPKSNSISSNSQSYNSNQAKNQTPNINSKILYSLTINTLPSDAKVKIVNITPKYQNGIKLEKGSYQIEVSKDGYENYTNSIILEKDLIYSIELKKINKNNKSIQDLNTEQLNMSGLSNSQIENIKSACSLDYYSGPAAYNECMNKKIKALKTTPEPNMSGLSNSQIENIKSACSLDYYSGPAAYNECMNKKI